MATCSAPGKIILFGEHAVVFGEPALATAIDLRTSVSVSPSDKWQVNHEPIDAPRLNYVKSAVERAKVSGPRDISVSSRIPEGSGMGSSAAVTVATLGALHSSDAKFTEETIASEAFDVEHSVQGRASPLDTSTCTHGHAVLVLREQSPGFLWRMQKGDRSWYLHHRDMPPISLVVGYTGIEGATGPLVSMVQAYAERSQKARDMILEIGEIVLSALDLIKEKNWERVGILMDRNHALLDALGVGHPQLDKLVKAVRPYSYGAKLTGAGGGGSMIALTEKPSEAARAIEMAGGMAFKVRAGAVGMEVFAE